MKKLTAVLVFFSFVISPVFAEPPLGVTYSTGSADIRVWAPNARSVSVIGDFNSWKPTRDDELVKDNGTGIWSGSLRKSRAKGAYCFLINGELVKRDPYGRAVSPNGRKSVFYEPGLFDWGSEKAPETALEDTIIYEMHVGTFNDPRPGDRNPATFDDVVKRLSYLSNLGVNTLCLLPIKEFHGRHSWGYNPCDVFAVEQTYGGPDGLKRLVRECHKRGIAVHLDIVHNHYGPQNLDLLQFDGTGSHDSGGIYFYDSGDKAMTPWGPRLKYSEPMVRRYIRDNVMMWLEEYRVDGFRWDSTINIRAYNNGSQSLPEGLDMLEEINVAIRSLHPGKWSIAEDSYGIGNFDASWDYDFHHLVMPVLQSADEFREMYRLRDALTQQKEMRRVIYVDNHDEAGRLNGQRRIASDLDQSRPGSFYAKKLSGIGALLTFTSPGIPLLFMGNEFQEYGEFHDDNPLDWSKARLHSDLLALHKDLISMRLNKKGHTPGLKGLGVEVPLIDNEQKTIAYWRWSDDTPADVVVVAINLSAGQKQLKVPFPSAGPWQMRLDTDWGRYGGGNRVEAASPFNVQPDRPEDVAMPAYSAKVFSLVKRPPRGAQLKKAGKKPPRKTNKNRPPLSMYASINLVGNFNDWDKTAWPFKLVEDYIWEAEFAFDEVESPAFKLSANDNGVIYWGGYDGSLEVSDGTSAQIKRLGKNFESDRIWSGTYRIRFNEDLLFLEVEKISDATDSEESSTGDPDDGLRIWTDTRGNKLKARLVSAAGVMVSLERENGKRIQLPANRFSEEDRAYIEDWIDEFGD